MASLLNILHEDEDLLVLHKPAGLVCHPTKGDAYSSLISRIRLHVPRTLSPQLIHRLDRETSGVLIVAKQSDAAREIRMLWEAGFATKEYLAIVHGVLEPAEGLIDAPLGPDTDSVVAIKDRVRADGTAARTRFQVVRTFARPEGSFSLVRLFLGTGRKHQIRIHLAHIGHPVVGDKLYGGDESVYLAFVRGTLTPDAEKRLLVPYQALHASRLWFPWRGKELEWASAPEPWFQGLLSPAVEST